MRKLTKNDALALYTAKPTRERAEKVIPFYKDMVHNLAKKLTGGNTGCEDFHDLVSVGEASIYEALTKYDFRMNQFSTYVYHYIYGHMRHYLRDRQKAIRIPGKIKEKADIYYSRVQELTERLGRPPTDEEICASYNINLETLEDVRYYLNNPAQVISFEGTKTGKVVGYGETTNWQDMIQGLQVNMYGSVISDEYVDNPQYEHIKSLLASGISATQLSAELSCGFMQAREIKSAYKELMESV